MKEHLIALMSPKLRNTKWSFLVVPSTYLFFVEYVKHEIGKLKIIHK